ncbi:prepilin-type N-terminal cleavage/methylation domain-containing protein [bacterium]|nr:prepilin-type N-terminal cleavage/methylation domain-containing protein [bacterium]
MRLKKGFTLAEILIVLMVIGVIATMTIPSMMKGVTESQLKAGYKKAYNTISNFAAMERTAGSLPSRASANNVLNMYIALNNSLSVKGYGFQRADAGEILQASTQNYPTGLTYSYAAEGGGTGTTGTLGTDTSTRAISTTLIDNGGLPGATDLAWIITDDNLAYSVVMGGVAGNRCDTKQQIAAYTTEAEAATHSCMIVYVDVNGLSKGPNSFETQGVDGAQLLTNNVANQALDTLVGDQYKIYVGIDGATAGPRTNTVTGRITSDLK